MRILTWNIQGRTLKIEGVDRIVKKIISHEPHVVVLTEVGIQEVRKKLEVLLKSAGYDCHWAKNGQFFRHDWYTITLVATRKDQCYEPQEPSFIVAEWNRWVEVYSEKQSLRILGTYMPSDPCNRKKYWKQVIGFANNYRHQHAIIAGDFNECDHSDKNPTKLAFYLKKLRNTGWIDGYKDENKGCFFTWQNENGLKRRLDYVFLSPKFKGLSVCTKHLTHEGLSDHKIVLAETRVC